MWDEGLFDIFVSPQWLDSDPFAGGSSEPLLLGLTTRSADGGSLVGPAPSAMREGAKRAVKTINKGGGILGRRVELVSSSSSTNLNELDLVLSAVDLDLSSKDFARASNRRLAAYTHGSLVSLDATLEASNWSFSYTGQIQPWTVPVATDGPIGEFIIDATGASGGSTTYNDYNASWILPGGAGANVSGTFDLITGQTLSILVGQQGYNALDFGSGGGGGSFVWGFSSTGSPELLVVAGGGGGAGPSYGGYDASLTTSGGDSISAGGTNGSGGTIGDDSKWYGGAGGGGYLGNGESHFKDGTLVAQGGTSLVNGGSGGSVNSPGDGAPGGFGGGGAGGGNGVYPSKDKSSSGGGGGGGGYSGGAGADDTGQSQGGGGGGSYVDPAAQSPSLTVGNQGNGMVTISQPFVSDRRVLKISGLRMNSEINLTPKRTTDGSYLGQIGRITIDPVKPMRSWVP